MAAAAVAHLPVCQPEGSNSGRFKVRRKKVPSLLDLDLASEKLSLSESLYSAKQQQHAGLDTPKATSYAALSSSPSFRNQVKADYSSDFGSPISSSSATSSTRTSSPSFPIERSPSSSIEDEPLGINQLGLTDYKTLFDTLDGDDGDDDHLSYDTYTTRSSSSGHHAAARPEDAERLIFLATQQMLYSHPPASTFSPSDSYDDLSEMIRVTNELRENASDDSLQAERYTSYLDALEGRQAAANRDHHDDLMGMAF